MLCLRAQRVRLLSGPGGGRMGSCCGVISACSSWGERGIAAAPITRTSFAAKTGTLLYRGCYKKQKQNEVGEFYQISSLFVNDFSKREWVSKKSVFRQGCTRKGCLFTLPHLALGGLAIQISFLWENGAIYPYFGL